MIVPVRIQYASEQSFSLKYTYEKPESIEEGQKYAKRDIKPFDTEPVANPLENHLKYLGMQRQVSLHRNGGSTTTYSAIFEAVSAGRFNLSLAPSTGDEKADKLTGILAASSTPIIIVNQRNPITAPLSKETTINYADNRSFTSNSGNNFLINLLILQPGDVFSLEYSERVERQDYGKKIDNIFPNQTGLKNSIQNTRPIIHKFPFSLNNDWGFNDWIFNYLPSAN